MTDIHATAGPYAVDALDPGDLVEYEVHLATCPTCQHEVAELCEAAAELSLLTLATPRPRLRARVLEAVRAASERPGPDPVGRTPGPVDEIALRRRLRRSRMISGLVAAVAAIAVGLGGLVYTVLPDPQNQTAQTSLEQQLYAAPDAVTTTSTLPGGGQVTFVASRRLNRALFVGRNLPDPGPNRLQLWTATGTDRQRPAGVARDIQVAAGGPDVTVFFTGNVAAADFLAVSLEPAASTPAAPTSPVLATGPVAA